MAFATLFVGMAFAQNPTVKAIDVEDEGVGGEAVSTGIYKNASAIWTKTLAGHVNATYWETPKTLRYTYQALEDDGQTEIGSPYVKYEVLFSFGEPQTQQQLVMDKLLPNTLYKFKVDIYDPADPEVEKPDPASGATIYTSEGADWAYFISAPAHLQPGELLWNAAATVEYLAANQQADVTGQLAWKFDKYNNSLSTETEIPEVVGHVQLTENDIQVVDNQSTLVPPMENTYDMGIAVGGKHYVLKAWASYTYDKKKLNMNADGTFGNVEIVGTAEMVQEVPVKEYTYGGSTILPINIHVGVLDEGKKTTVNVVGLPTGINMTQGQIDVTFDNGVTWDTYGANLSPDSRMAQVVVLNPDEKEFKFKICFWTLDENSKFVYFTTPDYHTTNPQLGTVHMGGVLTDLDLADKYLLWGQNHPAYVLPLTALPGVEGTTGLNINFSMFYKRHIEGNTEAQDLAESGRTIPGVVSEDKATVTFPIYNYLPSLNNSGAQMDSWYRFMQITAVDENEAYLNELKKTWNFYTSEGCVVTKAADDFFGENWTYECGNLIFDGEITARNPKNPTERLMDPEDNTQFAKLHYYDWAWTPGAAPTIDAIGIEHKDTVTFITVKDGADKKEFYTSKVSYAAPKKYNNGQTIEKLFVYEGAPMTITDGEYDFTTAYYKRTIENPTGEVVTYENYTDAWWGEKYVASVSADNKTGEYGPFTFELVAKGEVEEGWTVSSESGFTMASRRGKINLGSAGTPWDTENYNAVPTYIARPTDQLNVPTIEPQYIIHNIYNNIYDQAWIGPCDFTIHATLTEAVENEDGTIGTTGTPWTCDDVTGSIDELGQVKLDNKQAFIKVPAEKSYLIEGYMLYKPTRYTTLNLNPYTPGTPDVGPVVKVPFKIVITVEEEFDVNQKIEPYVTYWIVEEDADGIGQVEARIYDANKNPNKIYAQLLTNSAYPAGVKPASQGWVDAKKEIEVVDGVEVEKIVELGYYSFVFPVDNLSATDVIRQQYNFGYVCSFTDGNGNYGPTTTVAKNSSTYPAIFTPDPYRTFVKHDPAKTPTTYESETVGPWKGELTTLSNKLTNFFAFTNGALPTGFENWLDYWGNPEVAWNLVYNTELDDYFATALRGVTKKVVKNYAPTVRLNDNKNADGVRYSYFNDVEFTADDAKYTADFKGVQSRSVIVPFDADTEASVNWLSAGYVEDDGESVRFRFSQRKKNGEVYNHLDAAVPYVVVSEAGGSTVEFTGKEVTIKTSDKENENYMQISVSNASATLMTVNMYGSYSPKWNQEIVPNPGEVDYDLGYYRFKNNSILELMKKGEVKDAEAGTYWDASYKDGKSREWQENFNGVNAFECYFTFYNSGYAGSISVRFDDEDDDATMIENINVVTESSELFDLMGRKVIEPVKGQIYIQNGKKILF